MAKTHIPNLSALKVPAEQYESADCLSDFPSGQRIMLDIERKFIHGLVRFLKPKRVLEIGVAYGEGTAVLLNAVKNFKDRKVVAIDLRKTAGSFVQKAFPKSKDLKLFTGKDPCEVIEKFGKETFDFCVIDTAHIHPIESLNFLTVFPFLSENAVVVIHDLLEFTKVGKNLPTQIQHNTFFANKLLFDCLCGTKFYIKDSNYIKSGRWGNGYASTSGNIVAVQITSDTKKYIQNLFSMLLFPWGLLPNPKHLKLIRNIIKKHYSEENFKEFCNAVNNNLRFIENGYSYKNEKTISEQIKNAHSVIFYGAGKNCERLLGKLKAAKTRMPNEIWDINPNIKSLQNITVKQPNFTQNEEYEKSVVVITIFDEAIANAVKMELKKCNFSEIYLLGEIDRMLDVSFAISFLCNKKSQ